MNEKVTVDQLAQVIRTVDGGHSLGAAALAEAILEALPHLQPAKPEAVRLRDELRSLPAARKDAPLRGDEPASEQHDAMIFNRGWNACREAALAATGKQQVGEVVPATFDDGGDYYADQHGDGAWATYLRNGKGWVYNFGQGDDAEIRAKSVARELSRQVAAITARMQVGEVQGAQVPPHKNDYVLCYGGVPTCWHVKPEDMPAQNIDMGQFRPAVHAYLYLQQGLRSVAGIAEGKRLLALIDQSDATAGVGNG